MRCPAGVQHASDGSDPPETGSMVPLLEAAFRAADRLPEHEQTELAERLLHELMLASPRPVLPLAPSSGSAVMRDESTWGAPPR